MSKVSTKRKIPAMSWFIFAVTMLLALINFSKENLNPDASCMSIFFLSFVVITLDTLDLLTGKFQGKQQQLKYHRAAGILLLISAILLVVISFLFSMDFFTMAVTADKVNFLQFNPNENFSFLNEFLGEKFKTDLFVWAYYILFVFYALFRLTSSSFANSKYEK